MARPKKPTDELKDQRVPIMMSEDELKAIDDWRFANRIGSRGDAIRRLCQIGLSADEHVPDLVKAMMNVSRRRFDEIEKFISMTDKWLFTSKSKFINFTFDSSKANLKDLEYLLRATESLSAWIKIVRGTEDTDSTLANAEEAAKRLRQALENKKVEEAPEK